MISKLLRTMEKSNDGSRALSELTGIVSKIPMLP